MFTCEECDRGRTVNIVNRDVTSGVKMLDTARLSQAGVKRFHYRNSNLSRTREVPFSFGDGSRFLAASKYDRRTNLIMPIDVLYN